MTENFINESEGFVEFGFNFGVSVLVDKSLDVDGDLPIVFTNEEGSFSILHLNSSQLDKLKEIINNL